MVEKSLPHDAMTLYGKSQPDLSIDKSDRGFMKEGLIVGATITMVEERNYVVTGGTMELKKEAVHQKATESREVLQLMANMVRLAGYLSEKALQKDKEAKEVNIYGLLVSHSNPLCMPFKYSSCVRETQIMKGDELLLNDAVQKLLHHI